MSPISMEYRNQSTRLSDNIQFQQACQKSDADDIDHILGNNTLSIDYKAIEMMVISNNAEIVETLFNHGFEDEEQLYICACEHNCDKIVKWLSEEFNSEIFYSKDANIGLIIACQNGFLKVAKYLLKQDVDPAASYECNGKIMLNAPVKYAVKSGNFKLVEHFFEIFWMDYDEIGADVISFAIENNDTKMVVYMLQKGISMDQFVVDSIDYKKIRLVEWLIRRNVDIYVLLELINMNNEDDLEFLQHLDELIVYKYVVQHGNEGMLMYLARFEFYPDILLDKCIQYGTRERMLWIAKEYHYDQQHITENLKLHNKLDWLAWYNDLMENNREICFDFND